jgi:hypothetical protein
METFVRATSSMAGHIHMKKLKKFNFAEITLHAIDALNADYVCAKVSDHIISHVGDS